MGNKREFKKLDHALAALNVMQDITNRTGYAWSLREIEEIAELNRETVRVTHLRAAKKFREYLRNHPDLAQELHIF